MMIFLSPLPYGVFACADAGVLGRHGAVRGRRDRSRRHSVRLVCGRQLKILGAGSVALFAAVGRYVALIDSALSTPAVKFAVDAGVLLVTLPSIAVRVPFTLQYALEVVDGETTHCRFRARQLYHGRGLDRASADDGRQIPMIYIPGLPLWRVADRVCGPQHRVYFTKWYPEYRRAKYGTPPLASALPGT